VIQNLVIASVASVPLPGDLAAGYQLLDLQAPRTFTVHE